MIRNTARAGIPSAKYNRRLGVPRTETTLGRGRARYSTFVYTSGKQDPPLTIAGPVDADIYWERITYFLKRVVPVAEQHKVRLACHPQDPGLPDGVPGRRRGTRDGRGTQAVRGIKESRYHGLNFCQGTIPRCWTSPARRSAT